jgi:predicted choloylglycine hydrolase
LKALIGIDYRCKAANLKSQVSATDGELEVRYEWGEKKAAQFWQNYLKVFSVLFQADICEEEDFGGISIYSQKKLFHRLLLTRRQVMKKSACSVFFLFVFLTQFSFGQEGEIVAGNENQFILVRHYKIRGTNREIGKEMAQIAKSMKIKMKPSASPLRNQLQSRYIRQNYPAHYERMQGAAEEFGIDITDWTRDLSVMTYQPARADCSMVFYPADHTATRHNLFSRNMDFPVDNSSIHEHKELHICSRPILFEVYPSSGYASLYLCAFDLFGGVIDGMNSEGLVVAIAGEADGVEGFQAEPSFEVGLNEFLTMRFLLDQCKNVAEAKESLLWLKQYYSFGPLHYLIADREGKSMVFEFSRHRNQTRIVEGKGIQCLTNHLVSDQDTSKVSQESVERLNRLVAMTKAKEVFTPEEIIAINGKASPWMPDLRPAYPASRTLWHSLYDLNALTMRVKFYLGETPDPKDPGRILTKYSNYIQFQLTK